MASNGNNHVSTKPPPEPSPLRKAKFFQANMRILVTGGAGFIGSHLVDKLMQNEKNEVIVVDNYFTGSKDNLKQWIGHPRFELIRHDVTEPLLIEVDQIYHLACPASPIFYKYNPVKTIKTNVIGTLNMLGLAKRTGARIYILTLATNLIMNWTRGHTIGHGSSAAVSVAKLRFSDEVFAVKSVELSQSQLLQKEDKILSQLSSPYVVSYKGYDVTKEKDKLMFNLMMEYMPDGTLSDEIRKQGGRINEPLIGYYTKQIVQGLEYLHSRGISHCDVKGQNILVGKTGAKIADFGCARWVERDGGAEAIGGTPMFMAPEVARGEEQGCPADIWGLGCTIIEMITGGSPWTNVTNAASLLYRIAYSGESPEIPKLLSLQAKDFLSKCLRRDPRERWTAKQLLKHPFLEENSNLNSMANQDFATSSPTSILDQDIWNSETMSSTIRTVSSIDSPLQRVSKLGQNSGKPNWFWADEIWTTIRKTNEVDGTMTAFSEMELESCFGNDKLEINYYLDDNFCCNTVVPTSSVINSLNFPRHLTYSVNKIHCS